MVGITKEDNLSGEGFQQPVELDILVNAAGGELLVNWYVVT